MAGELVNGEARQAVAVLVQRVNDCQEASSRRWEQHDRAWSGLSQQVADVEKGVQEIKVCIAAGGVDMRKAQLDHSSKVWVAITGLVVVIVNAGVQLAVAMMK